jgi:molecular chaperone DnaJ
MDFDQMYSEFQDFFSMKSHKQTRGKDITIRVDLDFMEAIFGGAKTIMYPRTNLCSSCKGQRNEAGTSIEKCEAC